MKICKLYNFKGRNWKLIDQSTNLVEHTQKEKCTEIIMTRQKQGNI